MTAWAAKYVGIPFAETGSSPHGCNCWGLVRLVLDIEAGIDGLPHHAECSADDLMRAAHQFVADTAMDDLWISVIRPLNFDCVLMTAMTEEARPRRVPGHVGVMVDERHVLHVWRATNAVIMPIHHARIRHRVLGFYRHRSLA